MKALGLDISLTATGVVLLEKFPGMRPRTDFADVVQSTAQEERYARIDRVATEVFAKIVDGSPDVIVIEGLGQGGHGHVQAFVKVVELSGLIKLMLWANDYAWVEVPPSSLKKFVAGKGSTAKGGMCRAVEANWGFATKNDNLADAYGLAAVGLALRGSLALKPHQIEVLDGLKSGA